MTPPDRSRPNRPARVTIAVLFALLATVLGPFLGGIVMLVTSINLLNSNASMADVNGPLGILLGVICFAYGIVLGLYVILTGWGSAGGRIWTTLLLAVVLLLAAGMTLVYINEGAAVLELAPPALVVICSAGAVILLWGGSAVKRYFARARATRTSL
ncbi:hypothetical protein [Microbacterium sp. NPDC056052]|uniref:hypothetical protein n=1 Tax=Microbacterium sp. NPDC056052 TaxID=3345695 RepID=UPI0035DEAC3E